MYEQGITPRPKWRRPVRERFFDKVQKTTSCWIWTGAVTGGYGSFYAGGDIRVRAHRFSWELHVGPIPEGMVICHNCPGGDNPLCVNPEHAFLGTRKDNTQDKLRKDGSWQPIGERSGVSKLTEDDVREIRSLYETGQATNKAALGRLYGVDHQSIRNILRRRTWKHV